MAIFLGIPFLSCKHFPALKMLFLTCFSLAVLFGDFFCHAASTTNTDNSEIKNNEDILAPQIEKFAELQALISLDQVKNWSKKFSDDNSDQIKIEPNVFIEVFKPFIHGGKSCNLLGRDNFLSKWNKTVMFGGLNLPWYLQEFFHNLTVNSRKPISPLQYYNIRVKFLIYDSICKGLDGLLVKFRSYRDKKPQHTNEEILLFNMMVKVTECGYALIKSLNDVNFGQPDFDTFTKPLEAFWHAMPQCENKLVSLEIKQTSANPTSTLTATNKNATGVDEAENVQNSPNRVEVINIQPLNEQSLLNNQFERSNSQKKDAQEILIVAEPERKEKNVPIAESTESDVHEQSESGNGQEQSHTIEMHSGDDEKKEEDDDSEADEETEDEEKANSPNQEPISSLTVTKGSLSSQIEDDNKVVTGASSSSQIETQIVSSDRSQPEKTVSSDVNKNIAPPEASSSSLPEAISNTAPIDNLTSTLIVVNAEEHQHPAQNTLNNSLIVNNKANDVSNNVPENENIKLNLDPNAKLNLANHPVISNQPKNDSSTGGSLNIALSTTSTLTPQSNKTSSTSTNTTTNNNPTDNPSSTAGKPSSGGGRWPLWALLFGTLTVGGGAGVFYLRQKAAVF